MTTLTLQPVNFDDPRQTADFLFLLDHYMRGPTGNGKPMDDDLRARLPDELRRRPTVLCHVGYLDEAGGERRPVGLINCVEGFSTFAGRPISPTETLPAPAGRRAERRLPATTGERRAV